MIRFDALLSRFGYCSRREASGWVKSGRAMYRGQPVRNVSEKVDPHDVLIDGKPVPFPDGIYIALNKPTGCTCSHREEGELVDDLLPPSWLRRNPSVTTVGRLDKDTSGLLLITDDGQFVHDMTSPKSTCRKSTHSPHRRPYRKKPSRCSPPENTCSPARRHRASRPISC